LYNYYFLPAEGFQGIEDPHDTGHTSAGSRFDRWSHLFM